MDILWKFKKGTFAKIRVRNDAESMQHPIHFHGQRFVVISSNGADVDDRQWKDTYLLKSGETVDLLIEMSNPGTWMFHCHIAEHLQNGMSSVLSDVLAHGRSIIVSEQLAPFAARADGVFAMRPGELKQCLEGFVETRTVLGNETFCEAKKPLFTCADRTRDRSGANREASVGTS